MKLQFAKVGESFDHEFDLTVDGNSVVIDGLNAKAVEYLLQYGWAQSLQDCIAGREKKVREEILAKNPDASKEEIETAQAADLIGALGKRMDAILAGTVSTRTKLPKFEAFAKRKFLAAAKKAGKKVPENFDELLSQFIDLNRQKLEKMFEAEKASDFEI